MTTKVEYIGQEPSKNYDTFNQEIKQNIEIPVGKNAFAAGTITVAAGVEIVVPETSVFVVV